MTGEIPPDAPLRDRCEELIDEWREWCDENSDGTEYTNGKRQGVLEAASELKAVLNGEREAPKD